MSDLIWLSEAQMRRIEPYFPLSHGVPRVDDRRGHCQTNQQLVRLPARGMRGPCLRLLLAERKQIRLGTKRGDRAARKRDNQLGKVLPHCSDSTP